MNRYKVVRYDWDSDEEGRQPQTYVFEAEAFEFLSAGSDIVVIFKGPYGELVGAVNGFDHVRPIDPEDTEDPEVLDEVYTFRVDVPGALDVKSEPDTMAA